MVLTSSAVAMAGDKKKNHLTQESWTDAKTDKVSAYMKSKTLAFEATLLPFWGYCKFKKNNVYYEESRIFVIDNYPSFRDDYNLYMNELGYNDIKDKFKNIILEKYKCYQICIHNKTENQIFVQYLGISNKDFISFLNLYDYPSHIINFVQEQVGLDNYKINNEITIVYEIDTQKVVRTGFYGNI